MIWHCPTVSMRSRFDLTVFLADPVDVKGDAFVALYADEGPEIQSQVLAWHRAHGGVTRHDKIRHYEKGPAGPLEVMPMLKQSTTLFNLGWSAVVDAAWVAGAREFLQHHAGKIPMFVASATPQDELIRIVEKRGNVVPFHPCSGRAKEKSRAFG